MSYNTDSAFPENIDELEFLSDPGLAQKHIVDTHRGYIKDGKYSDASEYLKSQARITPVNADLLNMLQNRMIELQNYLLKRSASKCSRATYGSEPTNPSDGILWIE